MDHLPEVHRGRKLSAIKHIVALSGGKDSTALALRLRELNPDTEYLWICTPTGKELDEMFAHWRKLGEMLGGPIVPVMPSQTFDARIAVYNSLPNHRMRWCTRELKIEPMKQFLLINAPCVHYVGLRADEETRKGIYGEIAGVEQRYPLREWGWGIFQVQDYLADKGVEIPQRTDCDSCFFQTIAEWYLLYKRHPDRYEAACVKEDETGHTWRSPGRDTWPASLREMALQFESGRKIPNLDQHMQLRLGAAERPGMCEACKL